MSSNELAAFYSRYNACCNDHRIADLCKFVGDDVVINGTDPGLDAYADGLRSVVRAFPDYRWELRHLMVDAPWIAAHLTDTGTHRGAFDAGRIAEVWGMDFHVQLLEQLR